METTDTVEQPANVTIITGLGPGAWDEYGHNTLPSWEKVVRENGWKVLVCTEENDEATRLFLPSFCFSADSRALYDRFEKIQEALNTPKILYAARPSPDKYNFRFDAPKWFKMALYAWHGCSLSIMDDTDIAVWLDADVRFRAVPDADFFRDLVGDYHVAYLGRAPKHSETGCVVFRGFAGLSVAAAWAKCYESGGVLSYKEWHSAYIFDRVRERREASAVRARNLTPGGRGHVWFQSPLGLWCDHLKGDRKKLGYSPEGPWRD